MWHVSVESWHWIHQVAAPCNVIRGSVMTCHWIRPVAASCNVAGGYGMIWHWIRPNVRHIGILHLVSISTTSPQSTCHSAPVCEILSKSDHPRQKKMTSCRFSRWRISGIFDFRGPIMGSLKSPCTTLFRSSIDRITKSSVFEKIAFSQFGDRQTDRQTDEQMDRPVAWSRCREWRLNKCRCFLSVRAWTAEARGQGGQLTSHFLEWGVKEWCLTPTFSSHRSSLLLHYWGLGLRTAKKSCN